MSLFTNIANSAVLFEYGVDPPPLNNVQNTAIMVNRGMPNASIITSAITTNSLPMQNSKKKTPRAYKSQC